MRQKNMGTFVGTALYTAPEMLEFNQSSMATDLWALGCIIYEMIEGKPPFSGPTTGKVFQNIIERKLEFTPSFDIDAHDLIDKML